MSDDTDGVSASGVDREVASLRSANQPQEPKLSRDASTSPYDPFVAEMVGMHRALQSALGLRVLVTGGRNYHRRAELHRALDLIHRRQGIRCIIHGAYRGADALAGEWARLNGVEEIPVRAEWTKHGAAAGPIRNAAMIAEHRPQLVVWCQGGTGTLDCITKAEAARIPYVSTLDIASGMAAQPFDFGPRP